MPIKHNSSKNNKIPIIISQDLFNDKNMDRGLYSYKKTSTYSIGEENANSLNFTSINNNKSLYKKAKSYKDKINSFNNKNQNHLGTVLETINEVSNSKIDCSQISNVGKNKGE